MEESSCMDDSTRMDAPATQVARPRSLAQRMIAAAKLEPALYEEVEADASATAQAALVVGITAVASAIGAAGGGAAEILGGLIAALVGWLVWSGVTYLIGDKLLGGTATWGELLRTIGFAQSPGVLYVLAIVPVLGAIVRLAVMVWILVAGIIAIRQALDFSTGRAVLTAVLGWAVMALLVLLLVRPG